MKILNLRQFFARVGQKLYFYLRVLVLLTLSVISVLIMTLTHQGVVIGMDFDPSKNYINVSIVTK